MMESSQGLPGQDVAKSIPRPSFRRHNCQNKPFTWLCDYELGILENVGLFVVRKCGLHLKRLGSLIRSFPNHVCSWRHVHCYLDHSLSTSSASGVIQVTGSMTTSENKYAPAFQVFTSVYLETEATFSIRSSKSQNGASFTISFASDELISGRFSRSSAVAVLMSQGLSHVHGACHFSHSEKQKEQVWKSHWPQRDRLHTKRPFLNDILHITSAGIGQIIQVVDTSRINVVRILARTGHFGIASVSFPSIITGTASHPPPFYGFLPIFDFKFRKFYKFSGDKYFFSTNSFFEIGAVEPLRQLVSIRGASSREYSVLTWVQVEILCKNSTRT